MTVLKEYAVRVKGTQAYLPRPQRADGRGGSHLEPIDFSLPKEQWNVQSRYYRDMQIRSYTTKVAAQNLLNAWLQGKFYGDAEGDMWVRQQPHRQRQNMEIVEITIILPD